MEEINFRDISIIKDENLNIFRLYKIIERDGERLRSALPFGSFKNITKIKRKIYQISDKIDIKEKIIVKITKVNPKKDSDREVEFDIDNTEYISLGNAIKLSNRQDELLERYYSDFFLFLKEDKYLPIIEEKQTNSYGIFGGEYILLPNMGFVLLDENINSEITSFENNLLSEYELKEVKEVAYNLLNYLKKSKISQIIFAYSLISPFRYYLLDNGLKEFGFLGIRGESGIGKTTRIKILCNLFHSNYNYEGYDEEDVRTPFRFNNLQKIPSPMVIDDPENIFNILKSLLKTLGTSKIRVTRRGRPDQKMNIYLTYRPIVFSYNFINFKDNALFSRILNVDTITNREILNYEKPVKEEEINYLIDNIHILGNFFYKNITYFFDELKKLDYNKSRHNSKESVLWLGFNLMKILFNKLDINPDDLVFDYNRYLNSENIIHNEKDIYKKEIIFQIKKLTETNILVGKGYRRYNIFHLLDPDILDNEDISREIIEVSASNGIYLVQDGILLHEKATNHISLKDFSISKISDLKQFFGEEEYKIINPRQESGFKTRRPLKYSNNQPLTGFLLKKDLDSKNLIDNNLSLNEILEKKNKLLEQLQLIEQKIQQMDDTKLNIEELNLVEDL